MLCYPNIGGPSQRQYFLNRKTGGPAPSWVFEHGCLSTNSEVIFSLTGVWSVWLNHLCFFCDNLSHSLDFPCQSVSCHILSVFGRSNLVLSLSFPFWVVSVFSVQVWSLYYQCNTRNRVTWRVSCFCFRLKKWNTWWKEFLRVCRLQNFLTFILQFVDHFVFLSWGADGMSVSGAYNCLNWEYHAP